MSAPLVTTAVPHAGRCVPVGPPMSPSSVDHDRPPPMPRSRRALLRSGDLRQFFSSQGLGQIADAVTTLTLAQVIVFDLERGASPASLARALFATTLPFVVAGPLAGIAADRWHRRRTLAAASAARGVVTLAAIAVPITGQPLVGYVAVGVLLAVSRVLYTVRAASVPHLVGADDLVTADSLALLIGTVAGMLGAALGVVLLVVGPVPALVVASGMHALAAMGFLLLQRDLGGHGPVTARTPIRFVARRILRLVTSDPTRFAILATGGHRALLGSAFATFVLLTDARYDIEASGYAAAIGIIAAGGFLGTLTAPRAAELLSRRELAAAAYVLAGTALTIAWLVPHALVVMLAMMCAAFAFQNLRLMADALVQGEVADDMLGRVFSAYDIVYNLSFVAGALVALVAMVVSNDRSPRPFLFVGVIYLAGILVTILRAHLVGHASDQRRKR
jgi:predicted MFS family arabinose efflux permease